MPEPCENCEGRGHFRDPEDCNVIKKRNGGYFGQCGDCLGSGSEPCRCKHGVSRVGRAHRVPKNYCYQCATELRQAEVVLIQAALATAGGRVWSTEAAATRLCPAVDRLQELLAETRGT